MRKHFSYITSTILLLSFISLFMDIASEMLYPVMPVYLSSIGFSVLLIGILEGCAETIAGFSKGYFGKLSDITQKRLPFVQAGYALSALSKPLLAAFTYPLWIFFSRTIDRFGKGLRTGARDAMLSDATDKKNKAKVFGFHRSMDTFGAVMGPSLALIFLAAYPQQYKLLFLMAFIPGIISIAFTFFLQEKKSEPFPHAKKRIAFFSFFKYVKQAPGEYRKLITGLLLFALVNSSDVLLMLKMKSAGLSDQTVISVYIFYNLVYALFSFPAGYIADTFGIKKTFIAGLVLFVIVYAGFSLNTNNFTFFFLFFLYGMYAACTEGISKAWITNICEKENTATAIGAWQALTSICAFIASALAGFIWYNSGPQYAFGLTAAVVVLLVFFFSTLKEPPKKADAIQNDIYT